jgi:hypothetical protein
MIEARRLNEEGIGSFRSWLETADEMQPPQHLVDGADHTEVAHDILIDPGMTFATRCAFGEYLNERLGSLDFRELMSEQNDGLWAWLAVLFFGQLAEKGKRKSEHYIVVRNGPRGSLAYRQGARTSYELVHIHGERALVCLSVGMHTFGEMAEQFTSRQKLAHNRGFFDAAHALYTRGGELRKGASSKPKILKKRKPGDQTGLGGARRLAVALDRLDLTFDTQAMESVSLIGVLPREFKKWSAPTA